MAASLDNVVQAAYTLAKWDRVVFNKEFFPKPQHLGIYAAEYLTCNPEHCVGLHADSVSSIIVSVALTPPDQYPGGEFHLQSRDKPFKVLVRGAVVSLI